MNPSEIPTEIRIALGTVMARSHIDAWLGTPNAQFGGRKPVDLIAAGETGPIWDMIHELYSGQPG